MANTVGLQQATPSGSVPHLFSKKLIQTFDAFEPGVIEAVDRSLESDFASAGDTVYLHKPGNVTVSAYTVGSDTTTTDYAQTNASLVLNKQYYFDVIPEDIEKAASYTDLVKEIGERGMLALRQQVEDDIIARYGDADASNVIGSTTAPIGLTKDNVGDYFSLMRKNFAANNLSAAQMSNLVAVVTPDVSHMIRRSDDFVKATDMADGVLKSGNFGGMLQGFKIIESNRIATVSNTKPLMFFHKDYLSLVMRLNPRNVEVLRAEKRFGDKVRALFYYGLKAFNPKAGGVLYQAV